MFKHPIQIAFKRARVAIFAIVGFVVLGFAGVAMANPSYFGPTTQTSSATTTPTYMTPGNSTTTLVYNAYTGTNVATATPSGSGQKVSKADEVSLLLQVAGSSTASVVHVAYEYSQDGLDWYQNFMPTGGYSTTTLAQALGSPFSLAFPYASTTIGGGGVLQTRDNAIIRVPVPTNVVRAIITLTGANAAVWAQFVPVKQQQ